MANVIPGLSGGAIAVILGIYEDMTDAYGNLFKDRNRFVHRLLLASIYSLSGFLTVILFSQLFELLVKYPDAAVASYMFFIGVILGALPKITQMNTNENILHKKTISMLWNRKFIITLSVLLIFIMLSQFKIISVYNLENLEIYSTYFNMNYTILPISYYLWLFFCGILSAVATILPGFSGSTLLIALGEYNNYLYLFSNNLWFPIIVFSIGSVIGTISLANLVNHLLQRYNETTKYVILGLLLASIEQLMRQIYQYHFFDVKSLILNPIMIILGILTYYNIYKRMKK